MSYKKFVFRKWSVTKHLYVYLYNDKNQLNNLDMRPAYTYYHNDILREEQYYEKGCEILNVYNPFQITYYKNGNIERICKKSIKQTNVDNKIYASISNVYYDIDGNITCQIYLNEENVFVDENFETK